MTDPAVPADDRDRCGCVTDLCTRVATQEDLLCGECRADERCSPDGLQ